MVQTDEERNAQRKEYRSKPEVKARYKENARKFRQLHPNYDAQKAREYRKRNPEKVKISLQIYREKNRDTIQQRTKIWRERNPEKVKEYLQKNKEILNLKSNIYRKNHLKEDAKRSSEYRKRHPEKVKEALRLNHLKNREYRNKKSKEEQASLKLETFKKYSDGNSPTCEICKESDLAFLTLDHVRGRKAEGHSTSFSGHKLWRHLRKQNYPPGYQVLCWNCNVLKYRNESIVHSSNYKAMWAKNNLIKIKNQVLSHYSDGIIACKCCGFNDMLALGLDHIECKKVHGHSKRMTSGRLYSYLIKEKFPPGYQVFCYNCNGAKGKNSKCPHQLDKMKN